MPPFLVVTNAVVVLLSFYLRYVHLHVETYATINESAIPSFKTGYLNLHSGSLAMLRIDKILE